MFSSDVLGNYLLNVSSVGTFQIVHSKLYVSKFIPEVMLSGINTSLANEILNVVGLLLAEGNTTFILIGTRILPHL